jgi:hypothetical protein
MGRDGRLGGLDTALERALREVERLTRSLRDLLRDAA